MSALWRARHSASCSSSPQLHHTFADEEEEAEDAKEDRGSADAIDEVGTSDASDTIGAIGALGGASGAISGASGKIGSREGASRLAAAAAGEAVRGGAIAAGTSSVIGATTLGGGPNGTRDASDAISDGGAVCVVESGASGAKGPPVFWTVPSSASVRLPPWTRSR